jgi:hypothetical protein
MSAAATSPNPPPPAVAPLPQPAGASPYKPYIIQLLSGAALGTLSIAYGVPPAVTVRSAVIDAAWTLGGAYTAWTGYKSSKPLLTGIGGWLLAAGLVRLGLSIYVRKALPQASRPPLTEGVQAALSGIQAVAGIRQALS